MEIGPIFRAMTRNKARFFLIAAEVALTLAIVANCVGLILDARAQMNHPSGFDDDQLIRVRTTNFGDAFEEEGYVDDVARADIESLRNLPGVEAASISTFLPWAGGGSSFELSILDTDMEAVRTQYYIADPEIFRTLGVEVVAGRGLTADDRVDDPNPRGITFNVVISRALGELLFADGEAVGKTLEGFGNYMHIVGLIDRFYNPYGWPIHQYVVFFAGQPAGPGGTGFLVRAEKGKVDAVFGDLEQRLLAVADGRNVSVRTIDEVKAQYHAGSAVLVDSLNTVMALLVLVTSLGIVGLTAFSVTERRRQIGTRRALGATRRDIVRYFLLENWLVTSVGVVLGLALALALNLALVNVIDSAKLDWRILAFGTALLWAVGLVAALGPALRGAAVAPAVATRNV